MARDALAKMQDARAKARALGVLRSQIEAGTIVGSECTRLAFLLQEAMA